MEVATETILQDVAHVKNVVDKRGKVIKKATSYLKAREIGEVQAELSSIDALMEPANAFARKDIDQEGLRQIHNRRVFLQDKLEDHTAPALSGEARDALSRRLNELNDKIRQGMPTHEDMRRNPAGAVDQHRRWEQLNKAAILERRNAIIALNPGDDSKDLTNIDMIRPHSAALTNGTATFMSDAQIPGHFAMTPAAKDNWPLGEPKLDTPLKQAERAEARAAKPGKREWTDEQKAAARERGLKLAASAKAAREAKAAKSEAQL